MTTLEGVIANLQIYGTISLAQFNSDSKWYCNVATSTKGYSLTIKSDYNHPTALEAAVCCLERCRSTLPQLMLTSAAKEKDDDIPF